MVWDLWFAEYFDLGSKSFDKLRICSRVHLTFAFRFGGYPGNTAKDRSRLRYEANALFTRTGSI